MGSQKFHPLMKNPMLSSLVLRLQFLKHFLLYWLLKQQQFTLMDWKFAPETVSTVVVLLLIVAFTLKLSMKKQSLEILALLMFCMSANFFNFIYSIKYNGGQRIL